MLKEMFKRIRYRIAYKVAPDLIGDLEERLSGLLCHVTGGLLSYTDYPLKTMIAYADDYQQRICDTCEEKDVLQKEIEALRERLRHLLKSDVIRSYDEYDRKTHDYAKDICELDKKYKEYKEAYKFLFAYDPSGQENLNQAVKMRNELIELLNRKYDHFCDQCGVNKDSRYIESLADYLIAKGVIVTPCVAMVERFIKDNKFDEKRTAHNGKYAVVYVDKTKWNCPLIDITEQAYNAEKAEERIQELKGGAK